MEAGYVYIDSVGVYENEEQIGVAIQACFSHGKKRSDTYVLSKHSNKILRFYWRYQRIFNEPPI